MPRFEHASAGVYYEESGAGDPVLVLPGWGGSIEELVPLRKALESKFRVIAADLPGSGKSGPQPREYQPGYFQEDAAVMAALLDSLAAAPAHIVGFSDGGEYALVMAVEQPKSVRSVVTWGSAGQLPNSPQMVEAFATVVDNPIPPMEGFSAYMKEAYGEANARIMTKSAAKTFEAIMAAGGDISRSRAGEIACPVLLIAGEHDFMAPPALAAEMAGAITGAEFVEAKGASHAVHHEQPEWMSDTVAEWLSRR